MLSEQTSRYAIDKKARNMAAYCFFAGVFVLVVPGYLIPGHSSPIAYSITNTGIMLWLVGVSYFISSISPREHLWNGGLLRWLCPVLLLAGIAIYVSSALLLPEMLEPARQGSLFHKIVAVAGSALTLAGLITLLGFFAGMWRFESRESPSAPGVADPSA